MITADISRLQAVIESTKSLLREGLVAFDIWDRETGLPLVGFNEQPAADALMNRVMDDLHETLTHSGFPDLNRYFILDLEGGKMAVVQNYGGGLASGMLLDSTKVNMGVLMGVAIPQTIAGVTAANAG